MRRRITIVLNFVAVVGAILAAGASCDSTGHDMSAAVSRDGMATPAADAPRPAALPSFEPRPESVGEGVAFSTLSAAGGTAAKRAAAPTAPEQLPGVTSPAQTQQPGSMLIRSGQATVEVDSVDVGIARVRRLAQETGALIANTTVQTGREQQRSASLELRVPSDRFDAVVNGLPPIGKVEAVHIAAQDVGEEFVDLSARLANARRLEARLIELLGSRTGRLTDVLSVERELARVREQIERYEGRLRYLQARVAVSSLTIVVHEPAPVVATRPGENVIGDAFVEAWRRFVRLTAGFIASLGVLVPLGALAFGAFVLGRRYLPRKAIGVEQA